MIDFRLNIDSCPEPNLFQKARQTDGISPRSRRLLHLLPKPKNEIDKALARLTHVQGQMTQAMNEIQKIQQITSTFLKRHFELIPTEQVFQPKSTHCIPQTTQIQKKLNIAKINAG
jgi:uncharacterized protein involved in type VI secretion and phage assembly